MAICVSAGSSMSRCSTRLARVGNISAAAMPCSSSSDSRAPGSRNAGMDAIGVPVSSRNERPSGLSPA